MRREHGHRPFDRTLNPIHVVNRSGNARTRQDASHYLGLSRSVDARPFLNARLDDDDAEVRDIAAEALQDLAEL